MSYSYVDYIMYFKYVELHFDLNANFNCGIAIIVNLADFAEAIITGQSIGYIVLDSLVQSAYHDSDHFYQISDFVLVVNRILRLVLDFTRSLPEEYRNFSQCTVITVELPYLVEDFCNIVTNDRFSGSTHTEASDSKPGCPRFADEPLEYAASCGYWRHLCCSL